MEEWGIALGAIGILATAILGFVFWWLTTKQTNELRNFLVDAIASATEDPITTKRLIADRFKTGELRGRVFKGPDGQYHIGWDETCKADLAMSAKASHSKQ
jgi:hypothetical protein